VWEHNLLVVDEAARLRSGDADGDLVLMLGALCHDLGKPATTVVNEGRVRSPSHEEAGIVPTEAFLGRLRAPNDLTRKVAVLVEHHLAPAQFVKGGATPKAYRRLARKLEAAGLSAAMLHRVALADHLGRTTAEAVERRFPAGDEFLERMAELTREGEAVKNVVLGRHLIARGHAPGPWFGKVLAACRDVQDETGWDDPDRILERVLAERDAAGGLPPAPAPGAVSEDRKKGADP
jgi:tRNA nucleotidyltransferase (CCA-adding enzyme)